MLKSMGKAADGGGGGGGGLVLRVQAEGAQSIAAAGGLLGVADKKPDPYVAFQLNGATRTCAHVDDVEPLEYFPWPNAVAEFPVVDEGELARGPLVVHVKDKDLLKDRFIGGADISLGALLDGAAKAEGGGTRVLCQSRMFPLEYADEKRKSKVKPSGEVKLTITLIDLRAAGGKEAEQVTAATSDATTTGAEQLAKPVPAIETQPSKAPLQSGPVTSTLITPAVVKGTATTDPTASKEPTPSLTAAPPSSGSVRKLEAKAVTEESNKQKSTSSNAPPQDKSVSAESGQAATSPTTPTATSASPTVDTKTSAASEESRTTPARADSTVPAANDGSIEPNQSVWVAKRLTMELVSAANLTRPTSLGALFDRKPDPFVVLEFAGAAQSSSPLKNVDIKQPVRWNGVSLSFELPPDPTVIHRPKGIALMDLLIHVKDENLTKPTYMGGAKVSLEEFFDTSAAQAWTASSAASNGVERVYPLVFADERMKKRKACGEITVRFHFEFFDPPSNTEGGEREPSTVHIEEQAVDKKQELDSSALNPKIDHSSAVTSTDLVNERPEPAKTVAAATEPPPQRLTSDIQSLCVEVLCARQVRKPTAPSGLIKGMMKAVLDRKPDPYVVLLMQGQPPKKTATIKDADVAFVEWKNSAHMFEFSHKPYPVELVVKVRDHGTVGSDPFMGGARISLQSIWNEAVHSSERAEVVSTYPLVFADEQMTKHQPCGEITLRFRWVYASEPLPESTEQTNAPTTPAQQEKEQSGASEPSQAEQLRSHQDACLLRYLSADNLRLWNNPGVISTSHDLYIEMSCVPRGMSSEIPKQRVLATSRVLTDATKRLKPEEVVDWGDEALVIPIVVPDGLGSGDGKSVGDNHDVLVELKDKNAITKDTAIARKNVSKAELLSSCDPQGVKAVTLKVELEPVTSGARGKKSASTLALEMRLTLLPLDAPALVPPQSEAAIMTFFALTGLVDWDSPSTEAASNEESVQFGLSIQYAAKAQSKMLGGLLSSFSKPHVEDQIDFYPLPEDRSSVIWRMGFDTFVSNKQIQTAKEKEAFDLDIQLWCKSQSLADKKKKGSNSAAPRMVGSYQVSAWSFLSSISGSVGSNPTQHIQIPLGKLGGAMKLSYSISFRKAQVETINEKKAGTGSLLAQESLPGNGNLHLLVLYAQQLVPPANGAFDEKAEDLDPEVRVAIEPKYVKRKENPVRAMLKTRPLENAGATPTWNEYLRLEYRLPEAQSNADPIAALVATTTTTDEEKPEEQAPTKLPAPIVVIGVYDIQIPGERSSSAIIGKAELPLSAFALPKCSPSVLQTLPVYMTVDVHLAGKKTGRLTLEGVFEPLAPPSAKSSTAATPATGDDAGEANGESDEVSYRSLCRTTGRSLRDKAKALKAGELITASSPSIESGVTAARSVPGRIEVHVECARGSTFERDDGPITAHLWMTSAYDGRKELKSRSRTSTTPLGKGSEGLAAGAQWDVQVSLYTADIATDILRVELLSSAGTSLGSLKQPVSSLLSYLRGKMMHDEYPVLPAELPKAKKRSNTDAGNTLKLGLAFYQDQQLCGPVDDRRTTDDAAGSTTTIFIQCGRFIFADRGVAQPVISTTVSGNKESSQSTLTAMSDLEGATLTCKAALLAGAGGAVVPVNTKPQAAAVSGITPFVDWDGEVLCLEVDYSALSLVAKSYAIGTCPILRLEVIAKRKSARFHEVIVSYDVSLAALLGDGWRNKRLSTWASLYTTAEAAAAARKKTPPLVGIMALGIMVCDYRIPRSTNPFQLDYVEASSDERSCGCRSYLHPVPGVLCVRFIAGRNLTDVDANGEQDPYVIARVCPLPRPVRGLKTWECITSVSLNGGRHPQWNSPVYYLSCSDVLTDYLRLEVIDSNEEDHLPNASIGALDVALATLFRDEIAAANADDALKTPLRGKTAWLEAWLPIFSVRTDGFAINGVSDAADRDAKDAGEVRIEYRFVSYEYFRQSQGAHQDAAVVSPYAPTLDRDTEVTDSTETSLAGSVFIHVVRALNLPSSRGIQPAVRVSCPALGFIHVTSVGKQSICDPVWDGEVVEIPFKSTAQSSSSATVFVEIVDVAVRTANANALAVITFGSVNIDAFIRHPTAISYGFYPLGNSTRDRNATTATNATEADVSSSPSLFLGCQFIPSDRIASCQPFASKLPDKNDQMASCRSGQLHVKVLQLRFDLPSYFKEMLMSRSPTLRFKLISGAAAPTSGSLAAPKYSVTTSQKVLRVPVACTSISEVVANEGTVDWPSPAVEVERDPSDPSNIVLFEWTSTCHGVREGEAPSPFLYPRANPTLACELALCDGLIAGQDQSVVVGELELPIFDFMLLDGHLASGWYPLAIPSDLSASVVADSSSTTDRRTDRCGEVKLEVQFLPSLVPAKLLSVENDTKQIIDNSMTLVSVHVQQVRAFAAARQGVYAVSVDLMGSRAETKPSMTSSRDTLMWDEVLELALPKAAVSDSAGSMSIAVRNLANDSKSVVAMCNWVVPERVLSSSTEPGESKDGGDGIVVLQLFDPEWKQQSSGKAVVAEIVVSIQRVQDRGAPSTQPVNRSKALSRRRGVLYVYLNRPGKGSHDDERVGWSASAAVCPATATRELVLPSLSSPDNNANEAKSLVRLQFGQFNAVSVPGAPAPPELKCVMVVRSEQAVASSIPTEAGDVREDRAIGYAELSPKLVSSIVSHPRVEIFQQIQVQLVSSSTLSEASNNRRPTKSPASAPITRSEHLDLTAPKALNARILFVNVILGEFLVAFRSVTSTTPILQAFDRFRVEFRLLHNQSGWEKSATAAWNKERGRVEWSSRQSGGSNSERCVKLAYSNEIEIVEPRLQLVLFGLASKRQLAGSRSKESGDDDSGARIAYGQVSLLSVLTEPDWNSGSIHDRQIQLTAISGASENANGSIILEMGMGFIGTECTNDELEAQRAQARKEQMLLLAEGTLMLKKMFVVLGGDEERPITIAKLKNYLLSESKDGADELRAAQEVLQKAADQETDGDLDRLFAIMDVNSDGQISWDEYVHHVQTLFALADAASNHLLEREQQEVEEPGNDDVDRDGDDDDDDPDDEQENPDANSEKEEREHDPIASASISRVALPLPTDRAQVGSAIDRYDDLAPAPTPLTQEDEPERGANKSLQREEAPNGSTKSVAKKSQSPALTTRSVRTKQVDQEDDTNDERDSRRQTTAAKRESAVNKRVTTTPAQKPLSTSILDWKVDEVIQWLEEEMELGQYADAIVRNAVNGRLLLTLSEADLESELGVTAPLHKRKLMAHIAELQEVAGYPPVQQESKRTRTVRANLMPRVTETPAFIRREQLLYQVKQSNLQPEETPFNSTKPTKKRPMQTTLVMEQPPALATLSTANVRTLTRPVSPVQAASRADTSADSEGESFADAMQDILEAVGASTPSKSDAGGPDVSSGTHQSTISETPVFPKLPLIQIGSITSTDELFEIMKKRIHQLAGQLLPPLSQQDGDTFSDFGDDDDDNDGAAASSESVRGAQQQTSSLRLVFNAMANSHAKEIKLSRLRFQESLLSLLAIDASWHQFDLLFRRIDVNNNAELTFNEFQRVFHKEYIGFEEGDLRMLQDALVDFVVDRLDSQQWTLLELFKAFDRDGGGNISIAELGTLVRFLFARTPSRVGRKLDQRSKQPHRTLSNRQIYLLLSCIDVSSDHRIGQQEFLRFFFVVWSTRLMEVQDQLFRLEQSHLSNGGAADDSTVHGLNAARRKLRRALRTNFSRPFRDAMRCLDVRMPSPFTGLLAKLQLLTPTGPSTDPQAEAVDGAEEQPVQVWQVLKGQRTAMNTPTTSMPRAETAAASESRRRVQKGKNEVLRTRLTRRREPARDNAELRTPDARVALDQEAALKYDRRRA